MSEKTFKIVNGDMSDGYHTFDELYEHRCLLFIVLCLQNKSRAFWRPHYEGWPLLGLTIAEPVGQTYYLGEMPENVARYLANLWTRYNFRQDAVKGLWLGGGFNYSSKSEGVSTNKFMYDPSYVQWNSAAGYDWSTGKT